MNSIEPGISGFIDFNKINTNSKLSINTSVYSTLISNEFLNISLDNRRHTFYKYEEENNLLILGKGRVIDTNRNINTEIKFPDSISLKTLSSFFKNINGSFFLIIIDLKKIETYIITDKLGTSNIFFSILKNVLYFSDLTKYLADKNSEKGELGMIEFLLINYSVRNTIFKNINRTASGSIISISKNGFQTNSYFNALENFLEISEKNKSSSLIETATILKNVIADYSNNNALITLTSGLDSRLLLSGFDTNDINNIQSFTFGVKDNQEIQTAKIISDKLNIKHTEILLDNCYQKFLLENYFNFIKYSSFVDLNINRFHYLYVWKILNEKLDTDVVLTGIGGNTFLRDGLSISHQTNQLLYSLIYTNNKYETMDNYVMAKEKLLQFFNIKNDVAREYLIDLFKEIKNNDKYFNHFFIKINFGISNYFNTELTTENFFINTYSPFFDMRFIESLVNSGRSIFNYNFLENNRYKIVSHKTYAELIKILNEPLLDIKINRGYKPKLMLARGGKYLSIIMYSLNKFRTYQNDLSYENWLSGLKLEISDNNFSLKEKIKIEVLNSL